MAGHLFFQLADSASDFDRFHHTVWNIYNGDDVECYERALPRDYTRLYDSMRITPTLNGWPSHAILIWNALQWRLTSRREGEAVCIAISLGFDPSPLLNVPPDSRLQALFSMNDEWPAEVLFCQGSQLLVQAIVGCQILFLIVFLRKSSILPRIACERRYAD